MPSIRRSIGPVCLLLAALALPSPALADEADDLISLVTEKPEDMDRDEWKERRREAATRLGELRASRAVPLLLRIAEDEIFDVVGVNAITSLGAIGDKRAVPLLQRIAKDKGRDRDQRRAARKSLVKLGAKTVTSAGSDSGANTIDTGSDSDLLLGERGKVRIPAPASFPNDLIAASDRLTLGAGAARVDYDSLRDTPSLSGDAQARYQRIRMRERTYYSLSGDATVAAGALSYDEDDSSSHTLALGTSGRAQYRHYLEGRALFGFGEGIGSLRFLSVKVSRPGNDNNTKLNALSADLGASLGVGYGRFYNAGEALRLRRLEDALRRARVLGRPLTPDLGERILATWYSLRKEVGFHDRLVATVALLREAGVLLGEPSASVSYELMRVLEDPSLDNRPIGWDVRLGVGASYLLRDEELYAADGLVGDVIATANYGRQASTGNHEIVGTAFGTYRLLMEDGDPAPWATGAQLTWRSYVLGEHYDYTGAIEIGASAALADDNIGDSDDDPLNSTNIGYRLAGTVGWLWVPKRATYLRLSGTLAVEGGEYFLGAQFSASHGLLDASTVGRAGFP